MGVCPNFFLEIFVLQISDKMVKQMTKIARPRSPGLPLGGLEHSPGGREGGQTQVCHLQAGQEGQVDGRGKF